MITNRNLDQEKIAALWKQYDLIKKTPTDTSDQECALIYTRICELRHNDLPWMAVKINNIKNSFLRGAAFVGGVFLAMTFAAGFVVMIYWAIVILFILTQQ
jgi:hypothetical protein